MCQLQNTRDNFQHNYILHIVYPMSINRIEDKYRKCLMFSRHHIHQLYMNNHQPRGHMTLQIINFELFLNHIGNKYLEKYHIIDNLNRLYNHFLNKLLQLSEQIQDYIQSKMKGLYSFNSYQHYIQKSLQFQDYILGMRR